MDDDEGTVVDTEALRLMTPEQLFSKFDTDASGLISLEEFKVLLEAMQIRMSAPKSLKYFKMCDVDGSGEIDLPEFKVALFAVDPVNGNEIGFQPSALLMPLDTFEMFDEDGSGEIDEDEFVFVMEYLNVKLTDEKQEVLFQKYDKDGSGKISYDEFKNIWLEVADVKKELRDRGADVPKFATRYALQKMLRRLLDDEEEAEKRAMAEAARFRAWRTILEQKNVAIKHARRRAQVELCKALDAAGQIYVFGRGSLGQFDAPPGKVAGVGGALVRKLWKRRVTAGRDDMLVGANGLDAKDAVDVETLRKVMASSHFAGIAVAENTSALWGRRVVKAAVADTVILALSDLGDMWTWGGSDHWWYEVELDAYWQNHWRGNTTPRSQLLLGTRGLSEKLEGLEDGAVAADGDEALKVVLTYFDAWSAPPPDMTPKRYYEEVCLPRVDYNHMKMALECRGKDVGDGTKATLARMLYRDVLLEKRVLGERAHRRVHELEDEIRDLEKRRKSSLAKKLKLDVQKVWAPLREIQAEEDAAAAALQASSLVEGVAQRERAYQKWRDRVVSARRNMVPEFTPRGNSLALQPGGITARGAKASKQPSGFAAIRDVAAGAQHLAAVHQSGAMYTWGSGASGRLGLDVTQNGDPRADAAKPTLVQALESIPVVALACGHAHSACITGARDLYVWGSAASGQLGVGDHAKEAECYASLPILVRLPFLSGSKEKPMVRHVSCGASHTACVTVDGSLYVWGCGDGGRLGLGTEQRGFATRWSPACVESLRDVKMADVACGNACTICSSVYEQVFSSKAKASEGGDVYVAGSASVLGANHSTFTRLRSSALDGVFAVKVAAGFAHQAFVSSEGELYCWGNNHDSCCAQPAVVRFLREPTLVKCLYERPSNIALFKPVKMSSVYGGLDAEIAVDGNTDGHNPKTCISTQQDAQAWFEVDLGAEAAVQTIRVWNRCDEPSDATMRRDKFSSRLVPAWLMVSQVPYSDQVGGESLKVALAQSGARMHITKDQRCTTWRVPDNIYARYVRLQLEGFDFLHVAQVQVFGTLGANNSVGRCGFVECGKHVTVAVVKPSTDAGDVSRVYRRAVLADAHNADILRQRETFAMEFDKYGRGERVGACIICTNGQQCETCIMKHTFADELLDLPLGVAGRVLTLDETAELLLGAPKPPLDFQPREIADHSISGAIKRRLAAKKANKVDKALRTKNRKSLFARSKSAARVGAIEFDASDQDSKEE